MAVKKKKNIFEKVLNIALDCLIFLFGIILLISIYNTIQIKILKNDYSSFFGYSVFEVQTGSMADAINAGDWIIVKYEKNIKLDDIITFVQDGEFITHRVVEAYKGTYVTKGDANNTKDEAISQEQIVGKVVKILPVFGILRKTLFNPAVLITLIITIYLINLTFKTKKEEKKVAKETDGFMEKIIKTLQKIFNKLKQFIITKFFSKKEKVLKKEEKQTVKGEKVLKEEKNEEKKIEVEKEKEELPPLSEEDFDKTMHFRMVSVDKSELQNICLDIEEELPQEELKPIKETEKDDEKTIKDNLEILSKKRKRFKNILEKTMFIKSEEINEILNILTNNEKSKPNEATIKDVFLKTYIDAKYYNYCGDINVEYNGRNMTTRIDYAFKETANKLIEQYKGNDIHYAEKVKKFNKLFTLIMQLEQAYIVVDDLQVRKETYKNKILKHLSGEVITPQMLKEMVSKIIKTQKIHNGMIKYCLDKLETNMFELKYNPTTIKNIYALELNHNIAFSKVYSDYIVDKTYSEGIIAEEKIAVSISLLFVQIVKDMFAADFKKKYILYIPESLYTKENKLYNIFEMFEDEYAKNSIIVLTHYDNLTKNKKAIKNLVKDGYHFALDLQTSSKIKAKDFGMVELMDFIFIDKKYQEKEMIATLSDDIQKKIISEDMTSKIGSFWGE